MPKMQPITATDRTTLPLFQKLASKISVETSNAEEQTTRKIQSPAVPPLILRRVHDDTQFTTSSHVKMAAVARRKESSSVSTKPRLAICAEMPAVTSAKRTAEKARAAQSKK